MAPDMPHKDADADATAFYDIPLPKQLETFHYVGDEWECEHLLGYTKNGFHPVILGDTLPKAQTCVSDETMQPRYRILLKLGFGSHATVWLARDLIQGRNVALKILSGASSPRSTIEAELLHWIRDNGKETRGHQRILRLYESFIIRGPNGFHECLVTEIVASLNRLYGRSRPWDSTDPRFTEQLVEGFAFLHSQGITHGDPHTGNFGIAIPHLDQLDEEAITDVIANPEVMPVVPRSPEFPTHTIPAYQTPTVDVMEILEFHKIPFTAEEANMKIIDFGRGHWTANALPKFRGGVPNHIRPPEVEVYKRSSGWEGSEWSQAADVWSLGLSIFHLRLKQPLISWWGDTLRSAIEVGGAAPQPWVELLKTSEGISPIARHQQWSTRIERIRKFSKTTNNFDAFIENVQKMVITNPEDRASMAEILLLLSD